MDLIYDIEVDSGSRYLGKAPESMNLKVNDNCVIRKDHGVLDFGKIVRTVGDNAPKSSNKAEMPRIERKATVQDKGKANENRMRAKSAFRTAQKHIESLKLQMKLLSCHYSHDGKLVTFQFSADGRIDFRELVRKLAQSLNTRIDLRQIGVRDEAALKGGIGVCGLELCCNKFLRSFSSINVKMAKEQDFSLNPANISGSCGRLKCCLKYEHEGYLELDRDMPRKGALCDCPDGRGKIIDRNLLTREVTVQVEGKVKPVVCSRDDVRIVYLKKYEMPKRRGGKSNSRSDSGADGSHTESNANPSEEHDAHGDA
jgi:cell fate regulator YaaT (PSP1 superfamily)